MKINIKKNYDEAKWFTMQSGDKPASDDPQFKIRTYPQSKERLAGRASGVLEFDGDYLFDKFNYCLVDWKNVLDDESGEQLNINGTITPEADESKPKAIKIKRVVYDNQLGGIPQFVNEKLAELTEEREKDSKN